MTRERAACGHAKLWATMQMMEYDGSGASEIAEECGTRLCVPAGREKQLMERAAEQAMQSMGAS
jgi:hypothetical protein